MMPSLGAIVGDIVLDYVYSNFCRLVTSGRRGCGRKPKYNSKMGASGSVTRQFTVQVFVMQP